MVGKKRKVARQGRPPKVKPISTITETAVSIPETVEVLTNTSTLSTGDNTEDLKVSVKITEDEYAKLQKISGFL